MDRESQLSNVAFGGAWSEQIAGREALREALLLLDAAVEASAEVDLRERAEVREALRLASTYHPKGPMLLAAWDNALAIKNPGLRMAELERVLATLRAGIGKRLQG